ncbi:MAG: hypothetical protein KGJ86_06920 [Chloroflexota bacterium]|nr:hypothetical protein [Chloroflexota bacterium]
MDLRPEDLTAAAGAAVSALRPVVGADWTVKAGDLDWSCVQTIDHIVGALLRYATNLSTRTTSRRRSPRPSELDATPEELVSSLESAAAILTQVAIAAPPSARGFHPLGMADTSGFIAMGCDETLVHGYDIATGLGIAFRPPAELANKVVRRLFPWAPDGFNGWDTLLWANGRLALPRHPRLDGSEWGWQCAPLAEWNGAMKRWSSLG